MTAGFAGRTAVVTGAGSGIGAALSRALGAAGATVVCADIDEAAAVRTASTASTTARAAHLDVTDGPAVQGLVDDLVGEHGRLDLMFNNAGVNTASMGGLMAAGLITSYVATKHAAAVETPILDQGEVGAVRGRDYHLTGQGIRRPLDADDLARQVLAGVAADRAMVIAPLQARMAWRIGRLAPGLTQRMATRFVANQRAHAR